MKKKQKKNLIRVMVSGVLFLCGTLIPLPEAVALSLLLTAYLIAGYDTLLTAVHNIRNGNVFDENFLMTIATIGALCLQDYKEAVFVMLFFRTGELFEKVAVGNTRKSISDLMNIRPETARILDEGTLLEIDAANTVSAVDKSSEPHFLSVKNLFRLYRFRQRFRIMKLSGTDRIVF